MILSFFAFVGPGRRGLKLVQAVKRQITSNGSRKKCRHLEKGEVQVHKRQRCSKRWEEKKVRRLTHKVQTDTDWKKKHEEHTYRKEDGKEKGDTIKLVRGTRTGSKTKLRVNYQNNAGDRKQDKPQDQDEKDGYLNVFTRK